MPHWLLATLLLAAGCTAAPEQGPAASTGRADTLSPYAGRQTRSIKALSPEDLEGYRTAQGMGLARAAELNHYPGPKHVLALAEALDLTEDQRARTLQIFEAMEAAAIPLGAQIVDREGDLDALFAGQHADEARMQALLREIGALQADLRFVHLNAHVQTRALLTDAQVRHYDRLRGYTGDASHQEHDPAAMHH